MLRPVVGRTIDRIIHATSLRPYKMKYFSAKRVEAIKELDRTIAFAALMQSQTHIRPEYHFSQDDVTHFVNLFDNGTVFCSRAVKKALESSQRGLHKEGEVIHKRSVTVFHTIAGLCVYVHM